jgi:hypothetical protein
LNEQGQSAVYLLDVEMVKFLADLPAETLAPVISRPGIAVSPRVAAALCRRSPAAVRKAINTPLLPSVGEGKHQYIRPADLARWSGRDDFNINDYVKAFALIAQRNPINRRQGQPLSSSPDDRRPAA